MTRDEAIAIIRSSELAAEAEQVIAELKRSIRIRVRRASRTLAIGQSRLGGSPDLPRGFEWPSYSYLPTEWDSSRQQLVDKPPREQRFLHFVAQFRLEDFQKLNTGGLLPSGGWLYFFYDFDQQAWGFNPDDRFASRVVYISDSNSELVRTEHPQPDERFISYPCQVAYSLEWTLPEHPLHLGKDWDWDHAQMEDWCETISEVMESLNGEAAPFEPVHHFFGHPEHIQNDMRLECQLASNGVDCGAATFSNASLIDSLKPGAKDWRLLLQIDTDEDGPSWMWGDCGRIYYWIRENDLRQRAFDKTWLILQCS